MAPTAQFRAALELGGKTATGIPVPDQIVESLGAGRRPPVTVTINGHSYPSTIASMGGRFMLPVSAENRSCAGVSAGDQLDVHIELDTKPRTVDVPADLAEAFGRDAAAKRRSTSCPTATSGATSCRSKAPSNPRRASAASRRRSPSSRASPKLSIAGITHA